MFKRASLTVEAALACPIFIFAVLALLYIVIWFQTAEKTQCELVMAARTMSGTISDEAEADIDIVKRYDAGINTPILSMFSFNVLQRADARAFTGVSNLSESSEDPVVYVTSHGSVYHKNIYCSYIKVNVQEVEVDTVESLRNRSGAKYRSCEKCVENTGVADSKKVYIASYGTRYHADRHCSTIERNAMAVRLSHVDCLPPCSKCGGK